MNVNNYRSYFLPRKVLQKFIKKSSRSCGNTAFIIRLIFKNYLNSSAPYFQFQLLKDWVGTIYTNKACL
jgi:hypothetical protein